MILPQLANNLLKELTASEIKEAAKDFGLSHYYFTQKVKSVDANKDELFNAVRSIMKIHKNKQEKVNKLYQTFLEEYENYSP